MQEIVKEFLVESYEILSGLENDLVELEAGSTDPELLARIFRGVHTIKGTSGFLSFGRLVRVTHVGENLLDLLRKGRLAPSPAVTDALLALLDAMRRTLACIEATNEEGGEDFSALVTMLERLAAGDAEAPAEAGPAHEAPAPVAMPAPAPAERAGEPEPDAAGACRSALADSTIRVDVGLLDGLMNLVGELVLTRNQLLQAAGTRDDVALAAAVHHLDLITTELQEGVMKTRMQPIGNVWSKFPRVVRDLAAACHKQVRVEMEGSDTELDKTIIEAIKDPLTHIVRNAVDHGVEAPGVRAAAGKAPEARLLLRAYHEGGQVNIEIAEDGGGIDPEKIKAKAVERGLIAPSDAARMGDREALHLIFLPGFSTAERVSDISGRGVGMDVVRTNIEKIGGTVDVQSRVGAGTSFTIKIPLTLAIVPVLVVRVRGERFAIPQVNLLELVRLEGEQVERGIETVYDAPVYRLRGTLLPLVHLARELALEAADDAPREAVTLVVLQADHREFGLVVDEVIDTEEVVVKPLSEGLKHLSAYAGATIMGDGHGALILDVPGLAQRARVLSDEAKAQAAATDALRPGGYLLLGAAETTLNLSTASSAPTPAARCATATLAGPALPR